MNLVLQIALCFWEIFLPFCSGEKCLRKREMTAAGKGVWYLGMALSFLLLILQRSSVLYSRWYLIFEAAVAALLFAGRFRIARRDAGLLIGIFYEGMYGLDLLLLLALGYTWGVSYMRLTQENLTLDRIVLCAVSRGIVTAGVWCLARAFGDRILKLCERNRKIFLLILSMQHLSLLRCDVVFADETGQLMERSLLLFFLFYLFLIFFLLIYRIREKGEHEKSVLEQKADAAQQKYDALVEEERKRDLLVHDMRNHLIVLRSMLEEGETDRALGYIEGICRSVSKIPNRVETGNTVVDALLYEKAERAGEQGIRFRILAEDLADGFVEDRDWCCILGNLLDNALEGSRKAEGERWIILRLENRPFGIVVSVENSCSGRLRVSEGKLKSTREDPKGHGLGMESVAFSAEKYGGTFLYECENNVFLASVVLYR